MNLSQPGQVEEQRRGEKVKGKKKKRPKESKGTGEKEWPGKSSLFFLISLKFAAVLLFFAIFYLIFILSSNSLKFATTLLSFFIFYRCL